MIVDHYQTAAGNRYDQNVWKAQLSDLWGRVTGKKNNLADFAEVAKQLGARQQIWSGIEYVPLNQIVGSVGRPSDFTNTFLPRPWVNRERWSRIDAALNAMNPLPPVELYKIGLVYFVEDGHHRISVAQANGLSELEAHVTELYSPILLTLSDFTQEQWKRKVAQTVEEEENRMLDLLLMDLAKREYEERVEKALANYREQQLLPPQPGLHVELRDKLGDLLIDLGKRLKSGMAPNRIQPA